MIENKNIITISITVKCWSCNHTFKIYSDQVKKLIEENIMYIDCVNCGDKIKLIKKKGKSSTYWFSRPKQEKVNRYKNDKIPEKIVLLRDYGVPKRIIQKVLNINKHFLTQFK